MRLDRGARMPKLIVSSVRALEEAQACAKMMSTSEPWITLGRDYQASLGILLDESRERYVARRDDRLAGFLILDFRGAFVGYVQTVCVASELRGQGIGTELVAFAERRIFREHANVFMCVSSFNGAARKLYERLGYVTVGELEDYLVEGHSEILLRKSRGPISTYRAGNSPAHV